MTSAFDWQGQPSAIGVQAKKGKPLNPNPVQLPSPKKAEKVSRSTEDKKKKRAILLSLLNGEMSATQRTQEIWRCNREVIRHQELADSEPSRRERHLKKAAELAEKARQLNAISEARKAACA